MAKPAGQIRSVLIPITGERVLLPNATVAEVITFASPDPVEGSPDWLMGRVVWRGWRVPVFSLSMLGGWAEQEPEAGAKIAILKALGGNKDTPFMAMVTQGFPRLVTIGEESLEVAPQTGQADGAEQAGSDHEAFTVEMDDSALDDGDAPEAPLEDTAEAGFNALRAVVTLNGERAVIPDLQAIERLILEVL